MQRVMKQLLKQARRPTGGFWGFVLEHAMKVNRSVQECAVEALGMHPDHDILEIGFGFGRGLMYALNRGMREGSGTLYGVDHSSRACQKVSKVLRKDVASGKLRILNEDVSNMSLKDASLDGVYHTYCYHYWTDQCEACIEIMRVLKPGSRVIAGLSIERLRLADEKGLLSLKMTHPEQYMESLITTGFENVHIKDVIHRSGPGEIKIISATKPGADPKALQ